MLALILITGAIALVWAAPTAIRRLRYWFTYDL